MLLDWYKKKGTNNNINKITSFISEQNQQANIESKEFNVWFF